MVPDNAATHHSEHAEPLIPLEGHGELPAEARPEPPWETPTASETGDSAENGDGTTEDTTQPQAEAARTKTPQYHVFQKADPFSEASDVPPERILGWFRLLTSEPVQAASRGQAIKAATEGFTLEDGSGQFFVPRAQDVKLIPRHLSQQLYDSLDDPPRRRR